MLYMEVRLGQFKRKMSSDYRAMMQGYLDGCPMLGLRIGFLQRNIELD